MTKRHEEGTTVQVKLYFYPTKHPKILTETGICVHIKPHKKFDVKSRETVVNRLEDIPTAIEKLFRKQRVSFQSWS